jgi:hypothetical protein
MFRQHSQTMTPAGTADDLLCGALESQKASSAEALLGGVLKRKTHRTLLLILVVLGLTLPGFGKEPSAGTVLREKSDSVGEYVIALEDGHTLQKGDVVALHRAGQQAALGEAFVVRIQANQAVVSLKGDFSVRPGDTIDFVRRPSAVVAPAPEPPSAPSSTSAGEDQDATGLIQDPNGHFSLKLPPGWKVMPQTSRPDTLLLTGPSGQALFLGCPSGQVVADALRRPESRAQIGDFMSQFLHERDIELVNLRDVTLLNRKGLRGELANVPGAGVGYMVFLPGNGYVFLGLGMARTPAALQQTEALLQQVRLR